MLKQNEARPDWPKILILNDDERLLREYKRKLERDRYPICSLAKCVDEAQKEMDRADFDLLLVGIHFKNDKKPTGLDFINDVRRSGFSKLAMVVSGDSSCRQFIQAAKAGANDYYVKLGALELCEAVGIMLRRLRDIDLDLRPTRVAEICFFKCLAFNRRNIELMQNYYDLGFPSFWRLAELTGSTENAVKMRFIRIYKRLGISGHVQLAEVLTACGFYRK
jgi:DNA-binding response OmpR family regulator